MADRNLHGYSKHGKRAHPLYKIWEAMIARCENPHNSSYPNYGAKGITVCRRWRRSFPCFLADVGERPGLGYSIERLDSKGNYEPSNVIWATRTEQARNRPSYLKLSIPKVRAIRVLYASGWTYNQLADLFEVTKTSIAYIIRDQQWKE